jgi:hypothetical protein
LILKSFTKNNKNSKVSNSMNPTITHCHVGTLIQAICGCGINHDEKGLLVQRLTNGHDSVGPEEPGKITCPECLRRLLGPDPHNCPMKNS